MSYLQITVLCKALPLCIVGNSEKLIFLITSYRQGIVHALLYLNVSDLNAMTTISTRH